jgi:Ca2+-binding RTX toxin-like protein
MTVPSDMALLAAGSYWDIRKFSADFDNRAPLPDGWIVLTRYDTAGSGQNATSGFSARVYQNVSTGAVVISYAGTEFNTSSYGLVADFISGNIPLAIGRYGEQAYQAALLYQRVQADPLLGDNITFTGHSLGGGLASVMAVWFNRPAYVFAPAPFELSANAYQSLGLNSSQSRLVLATVLRKLGDTADPALKNYDPSVDFASREGNVQAWAIKGELLESQLGMFNWIEGLSTPLFDDSSITLDASNKHSIDLHVAALLVPNFEAQASKVSDALTLIMNESLYGGDVLGNQQVFVTKLVRGEEGVRSDDGTVLSAPNGMLTSFAKDLGSLVQNINDTSQSFQDALLAQSIEWYYWQNSYSTQFFSVTNSVLQYTTARGAGLAGAQNRADVYLTPWLETYMPQTAVQSSGLSRRINSDAYQQWTVVVTSGGASATAQDAQRTQILVGGTGGDNFTGGGKADLLLGGDGADTLNGGAGNDTLYGGAGLDIYAFGDQFCKDVVWDADGQGTIKVDGQSVGQARGIGRNVWVAKLDNGQFVGLAVYDDSSSSTGKKLVITRAGNIDNTVTINNFDFDASQDNGYLGIKLSPMQRIALTQGAGTNFWIDPSADISSLEGKQSPLGEGSGCKFVVSLGIAAKAGDTVKLKLTGQTGPCKAVLDDDVVDADGATITLAEGQTEVSFAFIQNGGLDADGLGTLSVTYQNAEGQSETSNAWTLTLQNHDDPTNTLTGDDPAHTPTVKDDLTGTADADLIKGLTDSDVLLGLAGNDSLDGGAGSDVLMGGTGADSLNGGDGDDLIYGSSTGGGTLDVRTSTDPITIAQGADWVWSASGTDADGFRICYLTPSLKRDQQPGDQGKVIDGGAGNDVILSGTGDDLVHGGDGNDDIKGMSGADVLLGEAGDDRIYGDGPAGDSTLVDYTAGDQQGSDFIDGGAGNDILLGQGGDDVIYGGADNDKIWGDDRDPKNTPNAVNGNDYLDGEDGDDTIVGGGKDDTLYGGAGKDELWGDDNLTNNVTGEFHGNDYLDGEDGDDSLFGGGKDDSLYGGTGNDVLYGDDPLTDRTPVTYNGNDYLDGEDGNDSLVGGGKDDTLYGGIGNDVLWGDGGGHIAGETGFIDPSSNGADYLDGEEGDDTLSGEGGNDTLYGGAGNDSLYGDDSRLAASYHGDDYIDGEDGDDLLLGQSGNDTLFGGAGGDSLGGGTGNDYLDGEDGDDLIDGGAGNDTLYGSAGNDSLQGGDGNDQLDGGEGDDQLLGGDGDDMLDGGAGANTLSGGSGNDALQGGQDADQLFGDEGDDTLYGGGGNDQLVGGAGRDQLSGAEGDDALWGMEDDDTLDGGDGSDTLYGGDGNDVLNGGSGDNLLLGQGGDDTLQGGEGNDQLEGGEGNDVLMAGSGNESFFGQAGNDCIVGGGGDDYIDGGDGNDTLLGGGGFDQLNGGAGDDTYVFAAGDSSSSPALAELVNDTLGANRIELDGMSIDSMSLTPDVNAGANMFRLDADGGTVYIAGALAGAITSYTVSGTTYTANQFIGKTYAWANNQTTSAVGAVLQGGKQGDTLTSTGGGATLAGGQGNDVLVGSGGNNTYLYELGDGDDTITDTSSAAQKGKLVFGAGIAPADLVLSYRNNALVITFAGNPGKVTIAGFNPSDAATAAGIASFQFSDGTVLSHAQLVARGFDITGSSDSETLTGTNLADRITGGAGNDTLTGNAGADTYTFNIGDGNDVIADGDAAAGDGDTLRFGAGILAGDVRALRTGNDVSLIVGGDAVTLRNYFAGGPDAVEDIAFADGTTWGQTQVLATVQAGQSQDWILNGDGGDNVLYGLGGNDLLDGGAGVDTLHGGPGNDTLIGGPGMDYLYGEAGSDTYIVGSDTAQEVIDEATGGDAAGVDTLQFKDGINAADVTMVADGNDLRLLGNGFDVTVLREFAGDSGVNQVERFVFADGTVMTALDVKSRLLRTYASADYLYGFDTSDSLSSGWGADSLGGRGGNDTLHGDQGDDYLAGDAGADQLFGDLGNDTLVGGDGDDALEGGAGWDRLDGGAGNDQYNFGPGQGMDILVADSSGTDRIQLAAGVAASNVTLHRVSSPPAPDLTFKADSLVIQLNGGSDQLWIANYFDPAAPGNIESIRFADGTSWDTAYIGSHLSTQAGTANTLSGTNKANTFAVDNWNDVISDNYLNDGDKVIGSVSYRLPETITDLTLTGTLDLFGAGTSASDILRGNAGNNWFDFVMGQGSDTLAGGQGDDMYRVAGQGESLQPDMRPSIGGAVITELAGEGTDSLISGFWSTTLPDNMENLIMGTPNPMSNAYRFYPNSYTDYSHKVVGNALNNVLDTSIYESLISQVAVFGLRANPSLSSIADFRLDGGTGADAMIGGRWNDTYVIDNAGDTVVETGIFNGIDISNDTVETPFETSLLSQYPNIENVTLTGTAAANATGNAVANRLDGSRNAAANRLTGGAGDDTYVVGTDDSVLELAGEGHDTVVVASASGTTVLASDYANVEAIRMQGNIGAFNVQGDSFDNDITGSLGNNQLFGGAGSDTLTDQFLGDITFGGGVFPAADNDLLQGGDGNDTLNSLGGADTLEGGAGDDMLRVYYAGRSVTARIGLGEGHDHLIQDAGTNVNVNLELKAGVGPGDVQLKRAAGLITATLADGTSLDFADADVLGLDFADGTVLGGAQIEAMLQTTDRSTPTTAGDLLFGTAGADTIGSLGGDDAVYAGAGNDSVDGGPGNDVLFGGAGADTLVGGVGNDTLAGGAGADVYRFGIGFGRDVVNDTYAGGASSSVDDGASDAIEFDASVASANVAVYQQISGTAATGLVLALPSTGDSVALQNEYAAGGVGAVEIVRFSNGIQWDIAALKSRIAGQVGSDASDDTLTAPVVNSWLEGRGGNDTLNGGPGNDTLDGGTGNDVLTGGAGNDTFYVDSAADQVIEASSGGTDTVIESVDNYVLPAQVEKLQLAAGAAPLHATGNGLANMITGNAGNNWLDGGAGTDTMAGGLGDDTYVVDVAGEVVTESAGEGNDTVRSAVTCTLAANLENLILTGTSRINGTGNALDNVLVGNAAANTLNGAGGNDRLDGGAGADAMTGGAGNDTYVVDSTSDTTVEAASGGIDTVETALTWTLASEVERLTLTGTALVNGTGNASNNWIAGNAAANTLNGAAGSDVLLGADGNDVLQDAAGNAALDGGAGNDTLTTGIGNDLLAGGAGSDTLTLGGGADIVVFNFGDGADTINAPTSGAGLGESNDTISLGGIRLADLTFSRVGSDLVLKTNGTADSLLLKGWYLAAGDQTVTKLQVVIDSSSDYAPGTADALRNSRIASLSFTQLVAAYDAARASNSTLVNWSPSESTLQAARLSSSETLALGGNLAYRYAHDGALVNVAYDAIGQQLAATGFGTIAQAIADFASLQMAPGAAIGGAATTQASAADPVTASAITFSNWDGGLDSQVHGLVQAMASFAPAAAGQITSASGYQSLETVIAANWQ